MSGRVILDYSQVAVHPAQSHRRRRLVAIAAILVVVAAAVFAATEGRALWRGFNSRPTATSHPLSADQVSGLKPIANPALDGNGIRVAPRAAASPAPDSAVLEVPYTVQAPGANWKQFENACEEGALLMYHDYLEGDRRTDIPPGEATTELASMEKWQVDNWGAEKDLTIERTGQLAQALWGYRYEVVPATQDSIQQQLAAGRPVVIPVMTHSLENHYYGAQTVYHEVLIKGYQADGIVANDGGVAQGKNWFYAWNIVFQAIDAQTPKMGQGRVALVLYK